MILGHILFNLFTSSRWADTRWLEGVTSAKSKQLNLIESGTKRTNTSTSDKAKTRFLPLVALAKGLHTEAWGVLVVGQIQVSDEHIPVRHACLVRQAPMFLTGTDEHIEGRCMAKRVPGSSGRGQRS